MAMYTMDRAMRDSTSGGNQRKRSTSDRINHSSDMDMASKKPAAFSVSQ